MQLAALGQHHWSARRRAWPGTAPRPNVISNAAHAMTRTIFAGLVFAVLYGIAVRVFVLLRARRESTRWHLPAIALASTVGGIGFYIAQQVRSPHSPTWLDLPAFAIMCFAASAIPLLFELAVVIPSRLARTSSIRVPARLGQAPPPPPTDSDTPPNPSLQRTPPG